MTFKKCVQEQISYSSVLELLFSYFSFSVIICHSIYHQKWRSSLHCSRNDVFLHINLMSLEAIRVKKTYFEVAISKRIF